MCQDRSRPNTRALISTASVLIKGVESVTVRWLVRKEVAKKQSVWLGSGFLSAEDTSAVHAGYFEVIQQLDYFLPAGVTGVRVSDLQHTNKTIQKEQWIQKRFRNSSYVIFNIVIYVFL